MKDVKLLLKEAREAIKIKDYETSLKLSKTILREDKTNYMALVFLGLSLQEIGPVEQAPKAFQRAIESNSANPLAWTGLINYYEKIDTVDSKKELIKLYSTAIDLETSEKKIIQYCEKLTKISDCGDVSEISKKIFSCCKNEKIIENKCIIFEVLADLLEKNTEVSTELQDMYEECLLHLIENKKCSSAKYSAYLSLLYKQRKYEDVLYHAEKMHNLFETDTIPLVWICKIFNQLYLEEPEIAQNNLQKVTEYSSKLIQIEPKNAIALFSKSIILLKENKLVESREILVEVTSLRPGLLHAWVFLTSVNVKLYLYEEAVQSHLTADKLLQSINCSNKILKQILDVLLIEILSKSSNEGDWKKALELYNNVEDSEIKNKCLEFIITVNINLEKYVEAKLFISDLKSDKETTSRLLLAQSLHKQKKYQEALNILETDPLNLSQWWIEIGLLYWSLEEYKNCLVPFLKAAKCDPNNYLCFLYLGHYYQKFEDFDKARRCYEKAFKINPRSPEIGTELSKTYRKLQNWEATQSLLLNLTTGPINKRNSWAWLQLGLSYLEQEDYSKAIDNFQFVVRIEPENVHCWESLADAYFVRGSYTSALKCYQKALELAPNSLYSSLQIANIKKILGQYSEARVDFEETLITNGQYVPALKGLAETCIYQAKECYRDQRIGMARDYAQIALEKLTQAIQQRNEFSCLWKLLADSCLFVARLPEKYCCLIIPKAVLEGKQLEGKTIVEREELYNMATRCYCKAVSLIDDNILIWHDLGTCYLHHALNTEVPEKVEQLLMYATAAARHCTSENSTNWQHWNLLGNIAMAKDPPNYALAQHAYIKAVTADHNSTVSWCNLGILYLVMDDIKLANEAFAQGQRSDPNYVNSWIGQAMIAERMEHHEAMDLFRHSTQLGQQQQGGLGYGHWVCRTLLEAPPDAIIYSIHNMYAIPVACDALTWYTEKNPYDGCAWNMLGILRERMGLKDGTLKAFKNAYRLCEREHRDVARINYGRILAKLEKFSEAIELFQEVQEATFNSGSGLALALFKDKQYEESYSAYEQALHWLTEEQSSQSDLLVALASMAYMFQGVDAAKTLLFQSIQLKPPSPWSLYATLSLGLLHNDLKLAKLVLNELEVFKDKKDCLKHYAVLLSYVYLLQGKHNKAVKEVSKLIHRHPDNPSVWLTLSLLLLRLQDERQPSPAAAKCAQVAMKFGQTNMDVTKVLCLESLASSLVDNNKQALISAQKAIHCYPDIAEGWAVLSSALLNAKGKYKSKISAMINHIENLNPSKPLLEWSRRQLTV